LPYGNNPRACTENVFVRGYKSSGFLPQKRYHFTGFLSKINHYARRDRIPGCDYGGIEEKQDSHSGQRKIHYHYAVAYVNPDISWVSAARGTQEGVDTRCAP